LRNSFHEAYRDFLRNPVSITWRIFLILTTYIMESYPLLKRKDKDSRLNSWDFILVFRFSKQSKIGDCKEKNLFFLVRNIEFCFSMFLTIDTNDIMVVYYFLQSIKKHKSNSIDLVIYKQIIYNIKVKWHMLIDQKTNQLKK